MGLGPTTIPPVTPKGPELRYTKHSGEPIPRPPAGPPMRLSYDWPPSRWGIVSGTVLVLTLIAGIVKCVVG